MPRHLGFHTQIGQTRIDTSLRLHNLLDQRYVSAVVVNERRDLFFEPGSGLGAFISVRIRRALSTR